jgi:hypothetical protein
LQLRKGGLGMVRILLIGLTLTASLAACSSSNQNTAAQTALQEKADLYSIGQIEVTWHKASSTQNVDLMMSLWAPDATFTVGGQTYTGTDQIRKFFESKAGPFQYGNNWISDSPTYKQRETVSGTKGTLYFECDYVDVATKSVVSVVSADQDVAFINGKWLITNSVAATPTLSV